MMRIPTIHQTDIFHPHADPDDHWDLACQFALSFVGRTQLKGILIDDPPYVFGCGDPAAEAVAQLNHLTGQCVPFAVGIPSPYPNDPEASTDNGGIKMILKLLEEAKEKTVIHIVGSCRDVAIAGMISPDLFRDKCRAIYLNAGSAFSDADTLEYNVQLDPLAYHRIFNIPCPIFWMPCFEDKTSFRTSRFGTYYNFMQKDILDHLSSGLAQYFVYALEKIRDKGWLSHIRSLPETDSLERCGSMIRNMWCTGGFLHAAGLGVSTSGETVDYAEESSDLVFRFLPVSLSCSESGIVEWREIEKSPGNHEDPLQPERYIFAVESTEAYPAAMTKAMRDLLSMI